MAKVHCVLLVGIVAVLSTVSALSDDEKNAIKAVVIPILEECGKEHGVTKEEVLAAKKAHDVDALSSCFYACFMKKTGMIDDKGLYAVEAAKENHKKFLKDEEDVKEADTVADDCAKVNEQEVSDGVEGCDRAKLLVHCLAEHKESVAAAFD